MCILFSEPVTNGVYLQAYNVQLLTKLDKLLLFQAKDVRIFFLNMNLGRAVAIMCKVLHCLHGWKGCEVILLISSMIFYHNTLIIQAYHKGLSYPQYVWITHGWYPEQWWNISQEIYGNQTDTCSSEEVAAFLNGVIAIQPFPTADDRYVQTKSGMVSD